MAHPLVLICLDVDGTLNTSQMGPVSMAFVWTLHANASPHLAVAVVSPSTAWPWEQGIPWFKDGANRRDNLLAAAATFPSAIRLYVSNNLDQAEAVAAGFAYIEAADFARACQQEMAYWSVRTSLFPP
jgi:hypothetical protein